MATGRRPGGPGGDIPDLDVGPPGRHSGAPSPRISKSPGPASGPGPAPGPRVSARPSGGAPPAAPPASGSDPLGYFGAGTFDADHFGGADIGLALETGDAPLSGGDPNRYLGGNLGGEGDGDDLDLIESSRQNAQSVASAPPKAVDTRKWPTGRSPDTAALQIDAVEVTVAADYGTPPELAVLTPVYAARVLTRKRQLRSRVKELGTALAEAERQRDERLVALVQDLRGKILLTEEGEGLFGPVLELEKIALDRREALAGTNAEYDTRAKQLDLGIEAARKHGAACGAASGERKAALVEAERVLERAEARKKRLYIEIRSILDAVERAGGVMNATQEAAVSDLEAKVAAQNPELDAATASAAAARAALSAAEEAEQKAARAVSDAERRRRALDQEFRKQIGVRSEGVSEAEERRFAALADVGRAVLALRGRLVDVSTETLDAVRRADELVLRRATELERHVRALDAHDPEALKNGLAIGVGAVVVVIGALGFLIFR